GQIDPEISDLRNPRSGKSAGKRNDNGNTGGGRNEVLRGESGHLAEVRQRCFAAIALPVGIGDERYGGIEGKVLAHRWQVLRVPPRDDVLEAENGVEQDEARQVEGKQRHRVAYPALLAFLIDAG